MCILQCILVYSVIRRDAHKPSSSKRHNGVLICTEKCTVHCAQHIPNAHVQHNTFTLHPDHCAQCTVHNKFPVHMCSTAHSQWVSRLGAATTSGALTNCSEVTAKLYGGYRVTSKQTEDLSSVAEWGNILHFMLNFLLTPTGAALYVPRCHLCLFA